jgi:hypothetical protein
MEEEREHTPDTNPLWGVAEGGTDSNFVAALPSSQQGDSVRCQVGDSAAERVSWEGWAKYRNAVVVAVGIAVCS